MIRPSVRPSVRPPLRLSVRPSVRPPVRPPRAEGFWQVQLENPDRGKVLPMERLRNVTPTARPAMAPKKKDAGARAAIALAILADARVVGVLLSLL
eukprot:1522440-Alexandrium_andersonii.AAC.1